MENFDIDINFNGVQNDLLYLNANGDTETETKPVAEEKKPIVEEKKPIVEEKKPIVEEKLIEKKTKKTTKKPNWAKELDKYTNLFKGLSSYETPAQRNQRLEKETQEKGKKTTILGLHPILAIGISFAVIIGGVVAVVKLKGK
jgi:hypothetical protein